MCTTRSQFILNLRSYMFRPAAVNRDQISLCEILIIIIIFFTLKIKFKINIVTENFETNATFERQTQRK